MSNLNIKNLYYENREVGKTIKASKRYHVWQFVLNDKHHKVELFHSIMSGKKMVNLDANTVAEDQSYTADFTYSFSLGKHYFNVVQIGPVDFEMRIDNKSFKYIVEEARNQSLVPQNQISKEKGRTYFESDEEEDNKRTVKISEKEKEREKERKSDWEWESGKPKEKDGGKSFKIMSSRPSTVVSNSQQQKSNYPENNNDQYQFNKKPAGNFNDFQFVSDSNNRGASSYKSNMQVNSDLRMGNSQGQYQSQKIDTNHILDEMKWNNNFDSSKEQQQSNYKQKLGNEVNKQGQNFDFFSQANQGYQGNQTQTQGNQGILDFRIQGQGNSINNQMLGTFNTQGQPKFGNLEQLDIFANNVVNFGSQKQQGNFGNQGLGQQMNFANQGQQGNYGNQGQGNYGNQFQGYNDAQGQGQQKNFGSYQANFNVQGQQGQQFFGSQGQQIREGNLGNQGQQGNYGNSGNQGQQGNFDSSNQQGSQGLFETRSSLTQMQVNQSKGINFNTGQGNGPKQGDFTNASQRQGNQGSFNNEHFSTNFNGNLGGQNTQSQSRFENTFDNQTSFINQGSSNINFQRNQAINHSDPYNQQSYTQSPQTQAQGTNQGTFTSGNDNLFEGNLPNTKMSQSSVNSNSNSRQMAPQPHENELKKKILENKKLIDLDNLMETKPTPPLQNTFVNAFGGQNSAPISYLQSNMNSGFGNYGSNGFNNQSHQSQTNWSHGGGYGINVGNSQGVVGNLTGSGMGYNIGGSAMNQGNTNFNMSYQQGQGNWNNQRF